MQSSEKLKNRIKAEEGFSAKAYRDDNKSTTRIEYSIGFGHQISTAEQSLMNTNISISKGNELFDKDIKRFENAVNSQVKRPISQSQFDALVMFTYNLGEGALMNVAKTINSGADSATVANQIKKYVYWKGNPDKVAAAKPFPPLVKRRAYEAGLFLSDTPDEVKKKAPSVCPNCVNILSDNVLPTQN